MIFMTIWCFMSLLTLFESYKGVIMKGFVHRNAVHESNPTSSVSIQGFLDLKSALLTAQLHIMFFGTFTGIYFHYFVDSP